MKFKNFYKNIKDQEFHLFHQSAHSFYIKTKDGDDLKIQQISLMKIKKFNQSFNVEYSKLHDEIKYRKVSLLEWLKSFIVKPACDNKCWYLNLNIQKNLFLVQKLCLKIIEGKINPRIY